MGIEKEDKTLIEEYIFNRYQSFIKGDTLFIGKAIIPIDMVVRSTIETRQNNPNEDLYYIVDYLIEYFQT